MTDWCKLQHCVLETLGAECVVVHNSAFQAMYDEYGPINQTILLNGKGNVTRTLGIANTSPIPEMEIIYFKNQTEPRPRRYLLRLINTSFDTTFVFSIDNHNLTVISSDFVAIKPYTNTSVLVGIGQRYNVVVEALPIPYKDKKNPTDGNYWIRTWRANCDTIHAPKLIGGYEKSGILRYNSSSTAVPESLPWEPVSKECSDETYSSLVPIVQQNITSVVNGHFGEEFDVILRGKNTPRPFPLASFALRMPADPSLKQNFIPLRVDYSKPTFLNLSHSGPWDPSSVVIPEDYKEEWVVVVLAGDRAQKSNTIGAHPVYPSHSTDLIIANAV
jgi:hypothetical protein